ncbi:RNA polymerase sigma factor [Ruminococcaceae bacterium OttesenSCG-928-A11]|nr:RNA polymerase sigma factor [Ruminococcaceae bacterium OttesenSCG-928-A11]
MTEQAFCELMERYEKLVYSICNQFTHDHYIAQDLVQDTFLAAWTHRESCPADNPKAWLARIATNKAKDHLKSAYHRRVNTPGENGLPEDGAVLFAACERLENTVAGNETVRIVAGEVAQLKEPYTQVAALYFLGGRSVPEIAEMLHRPGKTVQTQVCRARQKLRGRVEALQLTSTAC